MNLKHSVAAGAGAALLAVAAPLLGASREDARPSDPVSRFRSFTSSERSPRTAPRAGANESTKTVRGFYYYDGKPVWLERSQSDLSVRFSDEVSGTDGRKLVRGFSPSTRAGRVSRLRGRDLSRVSLARGSSATFNRDLARLKARRDVDFVYPAWVDQKTGDRLLLTDEVIVRLKRGVSLARARAVFAARGLVTAREIARGSAVYVLRLSKPKKSEPLAISRELVESGLVVWAEPSFVRDLQKDYLANDALFSKQWSLNNSGQNGGTVGADARLAGAWDLEKGSRAITIAVIDDGVQRSHPDLARNIFTNSGEIPGNRIDDDANGYVDDTHGWNFVENNPNVKPIGRDDDADNHGTAVAGLAAAVGSNSIGISGACPNCTILPVKISTLDIWATDASMAAAIVYASTMADVLNISWGGNTRSAAIQFALQYALTKGRAGKGAVVIASSGNGAGYFHYTLADLPPDTYRFRWVYSKDWSDQYDVGADTAWLAWVRFSDGEVRNFEEGGPGLPSGWTTGGDDGASWSLVRDPEHADEGHCWSYAAKAGKISNDQQTYIEMVKTIDKLGRIDFLTFISSEMAEFRAINGAYDYFPLDGLRLWVDKGNDGSWEWADDEDLYAGVPPTGLVYPAAYPQAIAVGASTSFDCRAAYSQFGSDLDLVVPSSGGGLTNPVLTTDRTGSAGYASGNYSSDFGGTSAAAPLAAGIAGLVLSRNPGLPATDVREILEQSAAKISPGFAAYDGNGHSDRYGFGRIDAQKALSSTPLPSSISIARSSYRAGEGHRALIEVRRSGNTATSASVNFVTVAGTARAGRDFESVSQKVLFGPGERSKTAVVPIGDDRIHEPVETLFLKLKHPSPGAVLARWGRAKLAVIDNDVRFGSIGSASLSQTVFGPDQTTGIKLLYSFARRSGTFGYVLSRREGKVWKTVQSVKRIGEFRGSHRLTVRKLFAGKRVVSGEYRLRLRADTNSRRLTFRVS